MCDNNFHNKIIECTLARSAGKAENFFTMTSLRMRTYGQAVLPPLDFEATPKARGGGWVTSVSHICESSLTEINPDPHKGGGLELYFVRLTDV